MGFRHLAAVAAAAAIVGGSGCGEPTRPTPVCSFTLQPTSLSFPSEGGEGGLDVTASDTSCAWTTTSSAPWLTVRAGATGVGSGHIAYSVAANPSTDARATSLTAAGEVHTVTQAGKAAVPVCAYALTPTTASFGSGGGASQVTVSAPDGCAWTTASSVPWLVVTSNAQGNGSGVVSYSVDRNREIVERTGVIAVADQSLVVTQESEVAQCEYSVSPAQFTPCMPGGAVTTTISTSGSCPWTVATDDPWLTVIGGNSGRGTAAVGIQFSSNYDAPRQGIVRLRWPTPTAGQNVQVTQAGCVYAVTTTAMSFSATGGTGSFNVLQQSDPINCGGPLQNGCVWSAVSDVPWITILSSMPKAGDDMVSFSVGPATGAARTGHIPVKDKVIVITQAGS